MHKFKTVDVFSAAPLRGNPVLVVLEADDLSAETMQAIAGWANLSETVFHLQADDSAADYRLRIFTPRSELPFAGHPTLGAAHALLEAGLVMARDGKIVQQCKAGLVTIEEDASTGGLKLKLPKARLTLLSPNECTELAAIMGASLAAEPAPMIVDVGPRWIVAELSDADQLLRLTPDFSRAASFDTALGTTGATLFAKVSADSKDIIVRSFAPADGVPEDPVCGSGNGAVAAFRLASGQVQANGSYTALQGACLGRDGKVHISLDEGEIYVGGAAVTTTEGSLAV